MHQPKTREKPKRSSGELSPREGRFHDADSTGGSISETNRRRGIATKYAFNGVESRITALSRAIQFASAPGVSQFQRLPKRLIRVSERCLNLKIRLCPGRS